MRRLDLLGAWIALLIFVLSSLVFVSRLAGRPQIGYWLGIPLLLTAIPLGYLLAAAPAYGRPPLYYVQVGLMILFLAVEAVVDYVLRVEFRGIRWVVIPYVMLFLAGTGGMLGIASHAGRRWAIGAIILFLIMAALAFVQRARVERLAGG
jgi:hypothetical protein